MNAREEAVSIALQIRDEAVKMNKEQNYQVFDEGMMPRAFIAALEAQTPAFTVAPVALLKRTARMGICSQTHHEHLMMDAQAILDERRRDDSDRITSSSEAD